jgi:G3E family GTPase
MIKVDVISGFLGAGKTTLIKKLFASCMGKEKIALIENEFGEIGIDGAFLKGSGVKIKEINAGCICCSLVGNFESSIKEIVDKYKPDRIIIEPSGVGKLSDIVRAVERTDANLKLNIVATVVDGGKVKMYVKNFGEFYNDQVKEANTIVMSKTDKLSPEKIKESFDILSAMNPRATIITTPLMLVDGEKVLATLEQNTSLVEELLKQLHAENDEDDDDEDCCCHHHHDDDDEHEHCHHHHDEDGDEHEHCHHHHDHDDDDEHEHCHHDDDDDEHEHCHHHHDDDEHEHCHHHHGHDADEVFTSWGKETVKAYTKAELEKILATLSRDDAGLGVILRSKGIVKATDSEEWYYFDLVAGDWEIRTGAPDLAGRVVVIGSDINEDKLDKLFG